MRIEIHSPIREFSVDSLGFSFDDLDGVGDKELLERLTDEEKEEFEEWSKDMKDPTVHVRENDCEGCLKQLDPYEIALGYSVCMGCTKARHRAVVNRKCSCRKKLPVTVDYGHRKQEKCQKCLGAIS